MREYAADPNNHRAKCHQRRAQIQSNGGNYTAAEWQELCERYGNICFRCLAKTKLTVDSIVPISQGGADGIGNLQPICRHCNAVKSNSTMNYRRHHDYLNGYGQDGTP